MIALFAPRRWVDQWGGIAQAALLVIALTPLIVTWFTGVFNGVALLCLWAFCEFLALCMDAEE